MAQCVQDEICWAALTSLGACQMMCVAHMKYLASAGTPVEYYFYAHEEYALNLDNNHNSTHCVCQLVQPVQREGCWCAAFTSLGSCILWVLAKCCP